MTNNFDISEIRKTVMGIIKSLGVSKKVYPNRPKVADTANDFVVVEVGTVQDRAAYGECIVDIILFAKDIDFVMNDAKLSLMYRKIAEGFPASSGRLLFDTEPNLMGDTPDDYDYHARIIRIKTTIKSI
jgi:hypothetical protein